MRRTSSIQFVIAAGLILVVGCDRLFLPQPAADPVAIFEHVWRTFDEESANLEERRVDWQALYARYRPTVTPHTTDPELFGVLAEMLGHIDDSHVSLTAPHLPYFNANRYYRENVDRDLFDLDLILEHYLEPGYRKGRNYAYGRIAGQDVAYVHLGMVNAETMARLPEMLDRHPDVAGYVVDLRHNGGGNHTFAFDAMGRFTDRSRYVFRSKTKNGPRRDDYTPWTEWHLKPSGRYVGKPIVVLTDRFTPSAAERMVMAFHKLPNATVVGDTTSGTFGTKISRELANGWYFALSVQKVEMFDGTSYEGIGLAPHVAVRNDRDEMKAGVDRVLETALEVVAAR
jgi:carboxyl-terminal processing protease